MRDIVSPCRRRRGDRETGANRYGARRQISSGERGSMSKPMTKTELVAQLAAEMDTDKKTAAAALDGLAAIVTREVAGGGAVTVPGIGKVFCRARPERTVRNPATGEQLVKPADKAVKVTIAKALKDSVND